MGVTNEVEKPIETPATIERKERKLTSKETEAKGMVLSACRAAKDFGQEPLGFATVFFYKDHNGFYFKSILELENTASGLAMAGIKELTRKCMTAYGVDPDRGRRK